MLAKLVKHEIESVLRPLDHGIYEIVFYNGSKLILGIYGHICYVIFGIFWIEKRFLCLKF